MPKIKVIMLPNRRTSKESASVNRRSYGIGRAPHSAPSTTWHAHLAGLKLVYNELNFQSRTETPCPVTRRLGHLPPYMGHAIIAT
jgi:hypothetical protein